MTDLTDYALALLQLGLAVVPIKADGQKRPAVPWAAYQDALPTDEQVRSWFARSDVEGLGVVCGAGSGQLEMLELEGRAIGMLPEIAALAADNGLADLWSLLLGGWVEQSPSGGMHLHYRISDGPAMRNTRLASRPKEGGGLEVLIETRGQGGFTVLAPSGGRTHPTGQPWKSLAGHGVDRLPTITSEQRDMLYLLLGALDQTPSTEEVSGPRLSVVRGEHEGLRPGDDFNARASWQEIIGPHGWKPVKRVGRSIGWVRPDKDPRAGISATTGTTDADNLYVFTTSTDLPHEQPLSKFFVYAHLEHCGDMSAAARELRAQGYGEQAGAAVSFSLADATLAPRPDPPVLAPTGTEDAPVVELAAEVVEGEVVEHSSWWPMDLRPALTGERVDSPPEVLRRSDGVCAFYPGRVNGVLGPSESGKTWVALQAAVEVVRRGGRVTIIDFEDSDVSIARRLLALDLDAASIEARVAYINPDTPWNASAAQDIRDHLADHSPDMVLVDGYNAAMVLFGLDIMSNGDATKFYQLFLKPLADTGTTVIYIDHTPKDKANESAGGIGAQAKRAMTSGCALRVEVVKEFGRGQDGLLRLRVDKDKAGYVRGDALPGAKGMWWADVRIRSELDGGVTVEVASPGLAATGGEDVARRPDTTLTDIRKALAARHGEPMSSNAICREVGGRRAHVLDVLRAMVAGGGVIVVDGPNKANLYRLATDDDE